MPPVITRDAAPPRASGGTPPFLASFFKPQSPSIRRGSLLSPAELERFGNLLVFARSTVEGYFAGKHKSPHRGSSVEFTDYKEYVPGDDIKRIDWRAYGRSRRLFVRQYEAETDMVIYLLVDVSASMSYSGRGAANPSMSWPQKSPPRLSYLMIHQGDKAALVLFADAMKLFLAPGGTRQSSAQPRGRAGRGRAGIDHRHRQGAWSNATRYSRNAGRLVVLSDFWDDTGQDVRGLEPVPASEV